MEKLNIDNENLNIHTVLKNKGSYLFYKDDNLFLMENESQKKVKFVSLKPSDDWNKFEFSSDDYYIISFDLRDGDLDEANGNRILDFLNILKKRAIKFKISRPLPRSVFGNKHISTFYEFEIPTSCRDCLELYKISEEGNTILCNGNMLRRFRFTKDGRSQVYNYLKVHFGEKNVIRAQNPRFNFSLIDKLNCTDTKRKTEKKFLDLDFVAYWISNVGWKPHNELIDTLSKYKDVLERGPILDYGGAHGKDSFLIKRMGFDVVLSDINHRFFQYTKEKQKETGIYFPIIELDSKLLPFEDFHFFGVYSGGVMHHEMNIDGVRDYLKESYRVLKHGGLFFGHVWAYWDFGAPPEPHLLQIRDLNKFKQLLIEAGFSITTIKEVVYSKEPHKHNWEFICQK